MDGVGLRVAGHDLHQVIGELRRRAVRSRFSKVPSRLRLDAAEDVGRAASLVLAIASGNPPRPHRPKRADIGMQHHRLNVRHFHEKLGEEHQIGLSYTWVKQALQAASLVKRKAGRRVHRKRRERRPLPGMMLHIDGSHHQWFQDERWHDLIVILDDATSKIYYAQLAPEETTAAVMAGLRAVIEQKGLFCALYSDRGAHFWLTPKSGGKVDYERPTQVGRAMKELGVHMIPAYSPQARGRSERNFSTWQGRLPQELRLHQIETLEAANDFLNEHYITEFNHRFTVPAAQRGTAFISCRHRNLEMIFTQRYERTEIGRAHV